MVRALALRGKSLLRQTNTAPHVVFGMQGIKINLEAIITWLKKKKKSYQTEEQSYTKA